MSIRPPYPPTPHPPSSSSPPLSQPPPRSPPPRAPLFKPRHQLPIHPHPIRSRNQHLTPHHPIPFQSQSHAELAIKALNEYVVEGTLLTLRTCHDAKRSVAIPQPENHKRGVLSEQKKAPLKEEEIRRIINDTFHERFFRAKFSRLGFDAAAELLSLRQNVRKPEPEKLPQTQQGGEVRKQRRKRERRLRRKAEEKFWSEGGKTMAAKPEVKEERGMGSNPSGRVVQGGIDVREVVKKERKKRYKVERRAKRKALEA